MCRSSTRPVKVTAALHPGELRIPTGILVEVELILETHAEAILVPKKALLYEGNNRVICYIVVEVETDDEGIRSGIARRVEVVRGFENPGFLEVLADSGIAVGDLVIDVGADRLADGDRVELAAE